MKNYTVVGVHSATKSQEVKADDYESAMNQADDVYSVSQCWHCSQDHEIDGDAFIVVYDNEGIEVYNDSVDSQYSSAQKEQNDALTQLNKELVEALGNVLWDICQEDEPNVSLVYLAAASGVLRKAKELAE